MRTLKFNKWRSSLIALGVSFAMITIIILSILVNIAYAENGMQPIKETTTKVYKDSTDKDKSPCDKGYKDESRCIFCHSIPTNKLIESNPDEARNYPNYNIIVRDGIGYYDLKDVLPRQVWEFFDYLKNHKINKAIIEIMSPGGSLFDAWTIVSYMDKFEGTVETRVRSYAASAGCLIFVGGDMGERYIDPTAILMWHELYTFKFLSIETPSSTEDEAKVLRKLQDMTNGWLADRTKLTKEEIDEKVKRKEFWISGKEAVEYGFADGFISIEKSD